MTRTFRYLILALAVLSLAACKKEEQVQVEEQVELTAPTGSDSRAWRDYLTQVVRRNSNDDVLQTFTYFLPGSDTEDYDALFQRQVDNVGGAIARGITAGNQLLFASPESDRLANLVEMSFEYAQAGSMNGVRVIFVGKAEDAERVKAVVEPTGAQFIFVEMK